MYASDNISEHHPRGLPTCSLYYIFHRFINRWTHRKWCGERPMEGPRINERRFKDLLLYGSTRLADDPTFGETKLNKFLFYCDFSAYRQLGAPITGAEYQKNLYGPTARRYPVLRDELIRTGQLEVERRMVADRAQDVAKPLVEANMDEFSPQEMAIIDSVAEDLRGRTNKQVSDQSHEREAGWRAKRLGETIPYSSALISLEPLSKKALDALRRLVAA
jgi:hypothetical protein